MAYQDRICRYWNSVIEGTKEIIKEDGEDIGWNRMIEALRDTPNYIKAIILGKSVEAPDKMLEGVLIIREE